MLKKPDNKSLITLTMMFLIGIAMIFIPLIQQRQEIESDNSIYAMIAEEIRHQQEDLRYWHKIQYGNRKEGFYIMRKNYLLAPLLAGCVVAAVGCSSQNSQKETEDKKPAETATKPPATQNADYIAWLSIPGTVIDYPVVRSDRTDYYLHHLITGQESKLGTLFSLTTSDYETPSRNIAIYGHHLSNSTAMFSTLLEYKKEDYWKKHQLIQVDSIYGKKTYRIFAVLNHTVSDWDASTASFKDDASFLKFVTRARKKAFYDTGITVSETDNIITLITCDRSFGGVQGRLLVMGVEQ